VPLTIRPQVLRMFTDAPNKILYAEDMAAKLGVPKRAVTSCVYNMRQSVPLLRERIEVMVLGNAWRYTGDPDVPIAMPLPGRPTNNGQLTTPTVAVPTAPLSTAQPTTQQSTAQPNVAAAAAATQSGRIFEEIGVTDNDDGIIVIDEDGVPYKLIPLEVDE
jgi:hypothetical protein